MKKTAVLFLLTVFLLQIGAYLPVVMVVHSRMKESAIEKIAALHGHVFRIVKINKSDKAKAEQVKEAEIDSDGQLYDIVRVEEHGNMLWCYCIDDDEEEMLLAQADDHFNVSGRDQSQQSKSTSLSIKDFQKEYIVAERQSLSAPELVVPAIRRSFTIAPRCGYTVIYGPPPRG